MQQPVYQLKIEGMVPDQREILIKAAYGDYRIWEVFTDIYQFPKCDRAALRSYIHRSYGSDGNPISRPTSIACEGHNAAVHEGSSKPPKYMATGDSLAAAGSDTAVAVKR